MLYTCIYRLQQGLGDTKADSKDVYKPVQREQGHGKAGQEDPWLLPQPSLHYTRGGGWWWPGE